jgi:hypothetical protein
VRAAIALAALLMISSPALADHVYSHRFVLEGRLLGSDDLPLPGREVEFFSRGPDSLIVPCPHGPSSPVTDEWGDFRFCFHEHELHATTRAGIRVGNVTITKPMDTAFRRTVVIAGEPNETGIAPPGWSTTFRVAGKAWQPGTTVLESVQVYGIAVAALTVNLTIVTPHGQTVLQNVTDGYGDFDFVVRLTQDEELANVTAKIETLGRGQPVRLDPISHRVTVPLYVENGGVVGDIAATFPQNAYVLPPGGTPPASVALVLVVLLALVGAVWFAKRRP